MNSSFSMPNLPGMVPNTSSWIYREAEGFQKRFTSDPKKVRPTSAYPSKPAGTTNGFNLINNMDTGYVRPSTAASDRLTRSVENLKTFTALQQQQRMNVSQTVQVRPATAVPFRSSSVNTFQDEQTQQQFTKPLEYTSPFIPAFVTKDKQVLRFYGYFYQSRNWEVDGPLGEPEIEKQQCRRITIYWYLIDDTVEIVEPKAPNTGMPGGTFFRRGKIETTNSGDELRVTDLAPGNSLPILGQEFYMTDADAYTRDYFKREYNMILPPALNRPNEIRKDMGAQYATGLGAVLPTVKTNFGTRSTDYLSTKETLDKTHRFLENAGKVLRFLCVEVKSKQPPFFPDLVLETNGNGNQTNGNSPFFDDMLKNSLAAPANVKRYALSYYLTSNSIELVVQKKIGEKKGNQGEQALLLKKSKLPKNWRDVQRGKPAEFYDMQDFILGTVVDVFGRYFLLVTCDKQTRKMYSDLGVEQEDVPLIDVPEERIVQPIPQLGDGFLPIGSAEDTLATVYGMPKAGKDIAKMQRNQGKLIRCKAVLLSDNPVDSSREFLISFFLEDDTIQVYEDVKRNSGIWGGNFLKRGRYMNDLPVEGGEPRWFIPTDIFLGNVISFHGNEFQIIEMDNMSLQFCENYPNEFPMMDTFKIIESMMLKVMDMQIDIRPIFMGVDKNKKHWLSQDEFIQQMDALGLIEDLNDQELLTLMRRFKDKDMFLYPELCDLFSYVYFQQSNVTKASARKRLVYDPNNLKEFLETSRSKQTQWRRTLRKDPYTLRGYVTLSVLIKIFNKFGVVINESTQKEIFDKYHVSRSLAAPIWKELDQSHATDSLFDGFDHKIVHKMTSLKKELLGKTSHGNNVNRKSSSVGTHYGSVLRRNNQHTVSHEGSDATFFEPALILIDYHKLCDDIYIADWI